MLDLLINDDLYAENGFGTLIDDIIVMFIAGMETIQISTTNLVQHLTILPDMKSRLLMETESVLKAADQTGLVRSLTTEMVDNFNFTRNCFMSR